MTLKERKKEAGEQTSIFALTLISLLLEKKYISEISFVIEYFPKGSINFSQVDTYM